MLIALAMIISDTANADEVQVCIDKCNNTIQKAQEYIKDLEGVNSLQFQLLNQQNNKITRLEDEASVWYRNPVVLFFTGLSVGIMLNQQANKH